MRLIIKNICKSFCHLSTHIQVAVLVLKQVNGMLKGAVCCHILDDLSIDVEKDFDLVLREFSVFIFIIKGNG